MRMTDANNFYPDTTIEVVRLINLDRLLTTAMGGILPGLLERELPGLHTVLDLGCGPGSWVLDVAFDHPECEVAGVDVRQKMIEYAWARTRTQQRFNASFGVMDLAQPLDFSDNVFDLVHVNFPAGAFHDDAWVAIISECMRILCPAGLFYLIDTERTIETNSPAFTRFTALLKQVKCLAEYCIFSDEDVIDASLILPQLLHRAGFRHVQCTTHFVDVSAGTAAWTDFFHNTEIVYAQVQPLLLAAGLVTQEEIHQLYMQVLIDLYMQDFKGSWPVLCISGTKEGIG
jgi:ubiquinone/menaquinone biosynthesis C-methylase UbiE